MEREYSCDSVYTCSKLLRHRLDIQDPHLKIENQMLEYWMQNRSNNTVLIINKVVLSSLLNKLCVLVFINFHKKRFRFFDLRKRINLCPTFKRLHHAPELDLIS